MLLDITSVDHTNKQTAPLAMRLLICFVVTLASIGCSSRPDRPEKFRSSLRTWADTSLARNLVDLIERIESGDMVAWQRFTAHEVAGLSGEHALTYSMACGELARRDPTIFLRRHLQGDQRAMAVGKRAYGWIGPGGRHTMNWLHESRLALSTTAAERQSIESYIAALQTVLQSIDRRYR
jgi:hypothetical protein